MLKRTKEYLIEELSNANSELIKELNLLNSRQITFNKHNEILKAWKKVRDGKSDLVGAIKSFFGVLLLGVIFALLQYGIKYTIIIEVFCALVEAVIAGIIVHTAIEYKKNKDNFQNIPNSEQEDFSLVGNTNVPIFEYTVERERALVDESNKDIKAYNEYIKIICDIIESDDYIEKIIKYNEEKGFFTDAFTVEWESFLNEREKPENTNIRINNLTEEAYKDATQHLHVDIKKLEKGFNKSE